ncbi:MAG: EscU/YscU/HrcU family type III secretion system export apparatus switch protein [Desulfuromonadaceae bacterium]
MADSRTKKAVALKYDSESGSAPTVVASGQGDIAERIIELAQEAGLHITTDPDLSELLAQIPIGHEIPEELYQAVAEVLAYVYRLNGQIEREQ